MQFIYQRSNSLDLSGPSSQRYENVSAFKGPLLNGALLLQYNNFLGGPLSYA